MAATPLIQPLSTPPHDEISPETPPNEENEVNEENEEVGIGLDYEKCREQRIRENKERLEKMGIIDLSLKLKTAIASSRRGFVSEKRFKTPFKSFSVGPTLPPRRSSRLQNTTPVAYSELPEEKQRVRGRREITVGPGPIILEQGPQPEVYTEEHEKLLGSTELPWTFGVDGYGPKGRIYDPFKGKTCHQCRQKTLGLRTHCSRCQIVQGQFCGDCLYARYGEHVEEARQNLDWICPPCRGICNCSLCRQARGWAPTGSLYRKVQSLGYRSVAHYLVATKRAPTITDKSAETPQSVKRSIPFKDMEVQDDDDVMSEKKTDGQNEKAASVDENDGSRKGTKKEDTPESKENNEDEVGSVENPRTASKKRGRPPKKTKTEDEGEELIPENKENKEDGVGTVDDPKTASKRRGRPPKKTKTEEESEEVISENKENNNEDVGTVDDPKTPSKMVGRPPTGTKKENGSSVLGSDSIARRLRSRSRV